MSLFGPTNYNTTTNIIGQTFGAAGMLPYQSTLAQVGSNALLNTTTGQLINKGKAELNGVVKKPQIPQQYLFTTDKDLLKDFFLIRLYSPSVFRQSNIVRGGFDKAVNFISEQTGIPLSGNIISDYMSVATGLGGTAIGTISDVASGALGFGDAALGVTDKFKKQMEDSDKAKKGIYDYLEKEMPGGRGAFYDQSSETNSALQNEMDIVPSGVDYKFTEIYLPMPVDQIIDSHSHEVSSTVLNPLPMILSSVAGFVAKFTQKFYKDNRDSKTFQSSSSTNLVDYLVDVTKATTRKTVNPNAEVLYQTPTPREFQFTFNFVPTNKDAADSFIEICDKLKEHSYPIVLGKGLFYDFPGTCDFEMYTNSQANNVLPYNKKPCLIKDVMVSYLNGTGTYTHFYDGNPTSIVLTITFIETELLSRTDFIPQKDRFLYE